jgi:hypothetical protein
MFGVNRRYRNTAGNRWAVLIVALAALFFGVLFGISGVKAALGDGTHGYFIPVSESCGRSCTWHGSFETNGGSVVATGVSYQGGVNGILPGVAVQAIYETDLNSAYPPHSVSSWIWPLFAIGVGVFGIFRWWVLQGRARNAAAPL